MTSPFVELRNVTIKRDRRTILDIEDLTIDEQSILAVLGQNGAGKSTLLRAVGGLIEPTEGSILLDGRPSTAGERRRVIAAVLQRPLLRRGTVSANVHAVSRRRSVLRRPFPPSALWTTKVHVS